MSDWPWLHPPQECGAIAAGRTIADPERRGAVVLLAACDGLAASCRCGAVRCRRSERSPTPAQLPAVCLLSAPPTGIGRQALWTPAPGTTLHSHDTGRSPPDGSERAGGVACRSRGAFRSTLDGAVDDVVEAHEEQRRDGQQPRLQPHRRAAARRPAAVAGAAARHVPAGGTATPPVDAVLRMRHISIAPCGCVPAPSVRRGDRRHPRNAAHAADVAGCRASACATPGRRPPPLVRAGASVACLHSFAMHPSPRPPSVPPALLTAEDRQGAWSAEAEPASAIAAGPRRPSPGSCGLAAAGRQGRR